MVRQDPTFVINGIDVDELRDYIESCRLDASAADRNPTVSARWVGGSRAEVTSSLGGAPVYMGGPDDRALQLPHVPRPIEREERLRRDS